MKESIFKISLLSGIGGLLEFYDFILYILFSDQISKMFFNQISSPFLKNILVIAVFSVAYIIRPLGGIIMGWLGDTQGRKTSFSMTIFIMGTCVFLMGVMPTYNQIGISATIIFIGLRMVQGFALGGELPSAVVFVFESLEKKGLALGIMFGLVLTGFFLGDVMSLLLRHLFGDYAWRPAFISGSFVAFISYYIRSRLKETFMFEELAKKETFPLKEVLQNHLRGVIGALFCISLVALYGAIISLYLPKYLTLHLGYNIHLISSIMIVSSIINVLGVIFTSWLSDYIDYLKLYKRLAISLIIVSYPAFHMMQLHNTILLFTAIITLALIVSLASGLFMRISCEAFPTKIRLTGVAIAYNLAFAIIGGFGPLIIEFFIKTVNLTAGPIFVSVTCGILGYMSVPILTMKPKLLLKEDTKS